MNWYYGNYLSNENRWDWISVNRKSGAAIGVFGLVRQGQNAEVNYLLAPEAQHRGYAAEAVHGLVLYAFKQWGVKQVTAEINKENSPSLALAARLGFRLLKQDSCFVTYGVEV